nr:hypothetical protein GCM10020092_025730 [Actinoplanes digitatis]
MRLSRPTAGPPPFGVSYSQVLAVSGRQVAGARPPVGRYVVTVRPSSRTAASWRKDDTGRTRQVSSMR